jgi:fibronectin type 3 domain-containing protein
MKIASGITSLTYDDANAESGKTYSYVVTAMDQRGLESRFSSEVRAVIP